MKYFKFFGKYVVLPLLLILAGALVSAAYLVDIAKSMAADANWFETSEAIDEATFVTIGDIDQFIRIRSRNQNHPVLLDLHGGPGFSQIGWAHRTLLPLTEYFTLVEWDQRGAGRSSGDESLAETMSYERMVDDTIELIEYLQDRFNTQKILLVGHSWGAMLGLGVVKKRPDLISAYVGVGQGLAWNAGFDETQRLIIEAADKAGDEGIADRLRGLPTKWPPRNNVDAFMERVGIIQAPLVTYGTSLHASTSHKIFASNVVLDAVTSPEISLLEAQRMLTLSPATKALITDLYGRDFRAELGYNFEVPIFIFQGVYDWQTPTTLVTPWFAKITAPHKDYVQFEDSAHFVINEEPGKFLVEMVNRVRPLAM